MEGTLRGECYPHSTMLRTGSRAAAQPILRRRLLDRLEGAWKVAVLSAPAGYGKSTLVRQWLRGRDALWCALGPDDRDTAHLLGSLIAAGLRCRPPVGERTARLFRSRRDLERDGGLLTSSFLAELIPLRGLRFVVIENAHSLADARESVAWLRALMEESGPRVRFLLTCRGPCPLPLARFELHGGLVRLERDDLALDEAERSSVLRTARGGAPPPEGVAAIEEMIGGWPAGWWLVARGGMTRTRPRSESDRPHEDTRDLDTVRERIFAFLAEELLSPLREELQAQLCTSGLLDELDPDLLAAILGTAGARAVLREAQRLDLLVQGPDGSDAPPRFHPLYLGFLRDRLAHWIPARKRARIAEVAARRYLKQGEAARAVRIHLAAGDDAAAVELLRRRLTVRTGKRPADDLGPIAAEIIRTAPEGAPSFLSAEILHAAALHELAMGHPGDAARYSARCREVLRRERRWSMLPPVTQTEATAAHITGRIAETARVLDALIEEIPRMQKHARGLILVQAANLHLYCGEPARSRRMLAAARSMLTGRVSEIDRARVRECEANVCFSEGLWDRYIAIVRQILPVYRARGFHARVQAFLINLAEAHVYLGREDEAVRLLDEAGSLVSRTVLKDATVGIAIGRARAQMDMGMFDAAEQSLDDAAAGADRYGSRYYAAQAEVWRGILERRRGRFAAAVEHFDRGIERFGPSAPHWINLARMERALALGLWRRDACDGALRELHECRRISVRLGDAREAARNRLYEARLEQMRGGRFKPPLLQALGAMRRLGHLVALRKEQDVSGPLIETTGAELPAPLREALRPYGFLAGRESWPRPALPSHTSHAPHPPRPSITDIRLLGGCEVRVAGHLVRLPRRASLELIARLALRPGEPLSREVIAEALWPGADPSASRNRFDVALNAARRAVEPDAGVRGPFKILRLEGGLCWLDRDRTRVDVASFEREASRCETFVASVERMRHGRRPEILKGSARAALKVLQDAASLYRGDLLPQFQYAEWTQTDRERLRDHHTRILMAIGATSLWLGRPEESVAAARAILDQDPCHEDAELLLLESLAVRGDRRALCRTYESFERRFRRALGFAPGPELAAVYREAMASGESGRGANRHPFVRPL